MFGFLNRSNAAVQPPPGRPQQQRTLQREASVRIDSKQYPVYEITEQGFAIENYAGDCVRGQRIYFDLIIHLGEREDEYRAEGVVVRVEGKILTCRFNDLRRDAARALQVLVSGRGGTTHPPPVAAHARGAAAPRR